MAAVAATATAMVGDSNLEKILSADITAEIDNNMKRDPFFNEDSSDEDEWGEDAEVEVEIKEKDNSTVNRLSRYSLGYLDFSDDEEGRVEDTLWYQLMVKHNNIITEKRPPPPQPAPPLQQPQPPHQVPAFVRYEQYLTSSDDDEEADKLFSQWGWTPGGLMNYAALSTTTGPTSHPALTT